MAAIRATARRGRDSADGGGAGRQRGRAGGRVDPLVGSHSAPARSGLARCEAVAGEGTGGADGRVEGGKRPSEVPVRAAAARVPSPSGCEALRRELNPADSHRQRGAATAASVRPPSASVLPSWGPGFLSTPSSRSPQSLSSTLRKPRRLPGPLAGRMTELQSALLLRRQLAELNKNPVEGFSAGLIDDNDLYRWEVLIIGPPDTLYEGGVFKAHLTFPKDYPLRPPKMKFITEIWHPNVDKNGDVCISILHEPGEDKYGYEKPEERWLPIHTVETIMISVISMLADPNGDSPANVDAAKEWREDRNGEFKRKVARCVRKSQETAFE
ncbi:ubiquitin-conjugating enzyme E2 G1 [Pteropus alecto]|uniref:ubiquitin-conjugating enzyme E2 G1 n=1 Tax=Pteropus alecto TaxID=9402 RepID=UPI000D5376DA|nr:ubiquitin-conjugating enzyme E2 G1 [Pteropus alecto]